VDGGGYPYWVRGLSNKRILNPHRLDGSMNLRTNDLDFMIAVQNYLSSLNKIVKPFLISNGGPIVLYAIENEYNYFPDMFETDKKAVGDDGLPERPKDQVLDGHTYITALRDITISVVHPTFG
jgi:hypothetical protein